MGEEMGRKILAIAVRTEKNGPMQEIEQVDVSPDDGLEGDLPAAAHRRITLLSTEQWTETTKGLGADLPWHTRRANVLLEGGSLEDLIGSTIRLGNLKVKVNAETKPCGLMDKIHMGLREALVPDCRGGVYGEIVEGGTIKVGDALKVG
ncbi:MAG: hypothetical protein DHS20C16_22790 [Phycisphaerae bacterium]|nr:MAG: hypothetical protein DHS20C16_22790 [Phycisphaerae bacterium]